MVIRTSGNDILRDVELMDFSSDGVFVDIFFKSGEKITLEIKDIAMII